jgi:peptidyl-prolyl cis-trans isomerase SurA
MMSGYRLLPAVLPLLLAAGLAGCSIPSWMPLVGKDKPKTPAAAAPAAVPPAAASPPAAPAGAPAAQRLPDSQAVMDRVICVVNNDAITLYELDEAEAHYLYETKQQEQMSDEARRELRDRLLQTIIENRIQLQQAEREKITAEDSEVQEQLNDIMKKVNAQSAKDFEEVLKQQGLSLDGLKKRIRDQILVQRVTRRKVALRISVTEQEIDGYINANRSKLETGLTFEARHILFLPEAGQGEDGWAAARKKAEQGLRAGEGRQGLRGARRGVLGGSLGEDGGSLGTLKRGELTPEIEQAILRLQPGESSPPTRSPVGYHLFHLDAKETLSGEALTQARSQIRDILYREKYDARLKEWIAEIKQRALIDIRL